MHVNDRRSRAISARKNVRRSTLALTILALSLLAWHRGYGTNAASGAAGSAPQAVDSLALLLDRAEAVDQGWRDVETYYLTDVAPIERVLANYKRDPQLVRRVALALVREARAVGIEPRLLLAVLLVENPWLDPTAVSPVGAVGLMQVMPMHLGQWRDCEPRLEDIEANICHGARIFAHYIAASNGDLDRALLRYNGCIRGTFTPDCHRYPDMVFAHAGRATVDWPAGGMLRAITP